MELKELAGRIDARVVGDVSAKVIGVASVAAARAGDVVFAEDTENLAAALQSQASAVIAGRFAESVQAGKALLIVANPRLAFARAANLLQRNVGRSAEIHPSAVIDASAKLGKGVSVGA